MTPIANRLKAGAFCVVCVGFMIFQFWEHEHKLAKERATESGLSFGAAEMQARNETFAFAGAELCCLALTLVTALAGEAMRVHELRAHGIEPSFLGD